MKQKKDKQLNDYLAGKDSLSSLYVRAEQAEPSDSVDKEILNAAHSAVQKKSKGTGPFSSSWFMPIALAAVLVLTVGIVVTLEDEVGTDLYETDQIRENELPAGAVSKPSLKKNSDKRKRQTKTLKSKQDAKPQPAKKIDSQVQGEEKESRSLEKQQAPKLLLEESSALEPAPTAAPPSKSVPVPASTGAVQSVPAEESTLQSAPAEVNDKTPTEIQSAPKRSNDEAEQGLMKREQLQDKAADTDKPAEAGKPLAAEPWLKSIRELIAQGKTEEAKQQLADFRRVYPDYSLGDEFKL